MGAIFQVTVIQLDCITWQTPFSLSLQAHKTSQRFSATRRTWGSSSSAKQVWDGITKVLKSCALEWQVPFQIKTHSASSFSTNRSCESKNSENSEWFWGDECWIPTSTQVPFSPAVLWSLLAAWCPFTPFLGESSMPHAVSVLLAQSSYEGHITQAWPTWGHEVPAQVCRRQERGRGTSSPAGLQSRWIEDGWEAELKGGHHRGSQEGQKVGPRDKDIWPWGQPHRKLHGPRPYHPENQQVHLFCFKLLGAEYSVTYNQELSHKSLVDCSRSQR